MRGRFFCKHCGAAITDVIEILSLKDPAIRKPEFIDQQPICTAGKAYKSLEPIQRSYDPERPANLEFSPQYWLNIEDIKAATKLTRKANRLNGCCGLDGCGGPNVLCANCGAEAGTMQSDCWTPLIFIPDKKNIEFKRENQ